MRTLTNSAITAGNKPETDEVFLYILEINHPVLVTPIRVVNNNENIISNGDTYLATAFKFTPPSQEGGELTPAKLTIDNIDRTIMLAVRSISDSLQVNASVILASDPDTIEIGPLSMELIKVSYNVSTITGEITYLQELQNYISSTVVRNYNFPGLLEWK
jgi:hypothetical protein